MPPKLKTSGSSDEAGVHCCCLQLRLTPGNMVWTASYFPLPILPEVCFGARCESDMRQSAVLQTPTAVVFDLTPITASCPIFCFLCSFWTMALSYVSSFLCFVFPLLSFLISLLNCAESWLDHDATESFQLQESIKRLKGSEIPPRGAMLICPCHTVVIWIGKSQTDRTFWDIHTKANTWKTLSALRQQN